LAINSKEMDSSYLLLVLGLSSLELVVIFGSLELVGLSQGLVGITYISTKSCGVRNLVSIMGLV
jgi:hypothetical protein